jgi:hypothetical protein
MNPLEVRIPGCNPGEPRWALVGQSVQDLGAVDHRPIAFLLVRGALETGIPGVVCREALRGQKLRLIENGDGRVNGADAFHELSFERDGNGHSSLGRHGVHHTE